METSIFDIALYIVEKQGEMTAMKLQKLVFYVKVWGLVWDEEEIFPEHFEAWANGAVSPALYRTHRGQFKVYPALFHFADTDNIAPHHKKTIDSVLDFYGKYTAQQLSDINHQEVPWREARLGCKPGDRCSTVITTSSIAEYYSGIYNAEGEEA
ncbi:MAG: type II toxin-antitoxin system antitoxin SocA domain-containing protein [Candidatus Electrothrix sp.]